MVVVYFDVIVALLLLIVKT